jgi:hypothetical protein
MIHAFFMSRVNNYPINAGIWEPFPPPNPLPELLKGFALHPMPK